MPALRSIHIFVVAHRLFAAELCAELTVRATRSKRPATAKVVRPPVFEVISLPLVRDVILPRGVVTPASHMAALLSLLTAKFRVIAIEFPSIVVHTQHLVWSSHAGMIRDLKITNLPFSQLNYRSRPRTKVSIPTQFLAAPPAFKAEPEAVPDHSRYSRHIFVHDAGLEPAISANGGRFIHFSKSRYNVAVRVARKGGNHEPKTRLATMFTKSSA